jgi:hypothetical protein
MKKKVIFFSILGGVTAYVLHANVKRARIDEGKSGVSGLGKAGKIADNTDKYGRYCPPPRFWHNGFCV